MTLSPLNLTQFLTTYFSANHCKIINKNDHKLTVQLTEEMDKAIMNRPFYWQYVKATGQKGEPMTLTFKTNHNVSDEEGELIHFGSMRLHTIFNELKQSARFVKMFETVTTTNQTMLVPWLIINTIVSFEGKQKKEELFSIGLQLINGTIMLDMMEFLKKKRLHEQISNYCYTISPLIKLESGFKRINRKIEQLLQERCYKWAKDSIKTLEEEVKLIHYFYKDEQDNENRTKEIKEATERLKPKIVFQPISGGIFYLTNKL